VGDWCFVLGFGCGYNKFICEFLSEKIILLGMM